MALPIDAALGLKPCCNDCFQNVVKSGGSTTPVRISAFAPLNAAICEEKLSVRF